MQGILQADGAEQASVHLRGGRQLRNHQSAAEPVPILSLSKVSRPGDGLGGRQGGSNARRKEFRGRLQPLQGN